MTNTWPFYFVCFSGQFPVPLSRPDENSIKMCTGSVFVLTFVCVSGHFTDFFYNLNNFALQSCSFYGELNKRDV